MTSRQDETICSNSIANDFASDWYSEEFDILNNWKVSVTIWKGAHMSSDHYDE